MTAKVPKEQLKQANVPNVQLVLEETDVHGPFDRALQFLRYEDFLIITTCAMISKFRPGWPHRFSSMAAFKDQESRVSRFLNYKIHL
jgi:hypothetical protein